jgi:hypothetical protein
MKSTAVLYPFHPNASRYNLRKDFYRLQGGFFSNSKIYEISTLVDSKQ